jgi:hypothetical protein
VDWMAGMARAVGMPLTVVTTNCRVTGLGTNLAVRPRRSCILGEVRTAVSVAVERPAAPVVMTTATTTEALPAKGGIAGGDVCSRLGNINDRDLLFEAHLVSKEVAIKFIKGQWVDSGCDQRHKRIIFGAESFKEKGYALKIIERLSGGRKRIAECLDGLKVLGDRATAFLDRCELEINLHDPSTGLRSEHGEQRVPERRSRGRADRMDDIGLGQCRNYKSA